MRKILVRMVLVGALAATAGLVSQGGSGATAQLASAGGCTGWSTPNFECISVSGSSGWVRSINGGLTWSGTSAYTCGRQVITANGGWLATGPYQCIGKGHELSYTKGFVDSYHPYGRWFNNGTRICTYFTAASSLWACVYIRT
jgi:hypothetical protein